MEGLLFDGVDAEAARASIRCQHHPASPALSHQAAALLPLPQGAVVGANLAAEAAVRQLSPVARWVEGASGVRNHGGVPAVARRARLLR